MNLDARRIGGPRVTCSQIRVRIEPNMSGTHIVWEVRADDGTKASGFAQSAGDAMRDATAFVEAMSQPRVGGGLWRQTGPRLVTTDGEP